MVRFVTLKGGRRSEPLRRYFHQLMAYLLDADTSVLRWKAELGEVMVEHGDVMREFRYHMRAETRQGVRLIRLVDDTWDNQPGNNSREPSPPEPPSWAGGTLEVWTRSELAAHPLLSTAHDLHYQRARNWALTLPLKLGAMAAQQQFATLGDVHERLGKDEVDWEDVLSLVTHGFIEVEMTDPLGPGMRVTSCGSSGHEQ